MVAGCWKSKRRPGIGAAAEDRSLPYTVAENLLKLIMCLLPCLSVVSPCPQRLGRTNARRRTQTL